jgi:MFS family permease
MDSVAPKDIRSSAQGLLTLVIYGFGMWIGSWFSGWVQSMFTENSQTDWRSVFLVPTGLTILCALVLFATFPRGSMQEVTADREPDPLRDLERVRESSVSGDKT